MIKNTKYNIIYEHIKNKILTSEYKELERLPSELNLCLLYSTSRITVRKALNKLYLEGFIFKIKGSGNFISSKPLIQNRGKFNNFFDDIKNSGKTLYSKVLFVGKINTPEIIKNKMNTTKNKIYLIKWIRYVNNNPIIYEEIYLNSNKINDLENFDLETEKLQKILCDNFNIKTTNTIEQFKPCLLNTYISNILKQKIDKLGMNIEKTLYEKEYIFQHSISYVPSEKFIYTIRY